MLSPKPRKGSWSQKPDGRLEARDATGNLAFILDVSGLQIEFKKRGIVSTFNLNEAEGFTPENKGATQ